MEAGTKVRIVDQSSRWFGEIGTVLADRGAEGVWVEVPGPYQYNRYWFGASQLEIAA